ncbi:hypothetical protein LCGC14_2413170 [marine sediment metagenome]|uniref:Uncharacterized protein n=1 Tax=marine sediment metagenome TaxID=412755 RepID=A0A0F9CDZ1_9ZZZZ
MTRTPYNTDDTLSRRLYLLRTNHYAQAKLSAPQKRIISTRHRTNSPSAGKTGTVLSLTDLSQRVCQAGFEANPPPKSP